MNTTLLDLDDVVIIGEGRFAHLVRVGSISTIEVSRNYLTVRANGLEPLLMRGSLTHCKKRFPEPFFAIGRSCMVNLAEVSKVNMSSRTFTLTMKDGTQVVTSKLQSRAFRKALSL